MFASTIINVHPSKTPIAAIGTWLPRHLDRPIVGISYEFNRRAGHPSQALRWSMQYTCRKVPAEGCKQSAVIGIVAGIVHRSRSSTTIIACPLHRTREFRLTLIEATTRRWIGTTHRGNNAVSVTHQMLITRI